MVDCWVQASNFDDDVVKCGIDVIPYREFNLTSNLGLIGSTF